MKIFATCLFSLLIASVIFAQNADLELPTGWLENTLTAKTSEVTPRNFFTTKSIKKVKPWVIWIDGQPLLTKEGRQMKEFLELWYLLNKVSK